MNPQHAAVWVRLHAIFQVSGHPALGPISLWAHQPAEKSVWQLMPDDAALIYRYAEWTPSRIPHSVPSCFNFPIS